ncbi:hypothetical protein WME73_28970 [Sorangium sp. So ce302]|uniref:hypothetical protein n=1 Tax=unclassified Sorangium TaxID=2621164 RepID=UPI003F5DF9F0
MEQHSWKRTGPHRLAITSILLVAGALVFASTASAGRGRDHPGFGFTEADVRGRYVFSLQGEAGGTPVASVGFFVADGTGNITLGRRTVSSEEGIDRQTFTCTYEVEDDGTGSAVCTIDDGTRESYDFVLERQGNAARLIRTDPGFVVLGEASRK